ncbi:glycosyltransferase [Intrasporangium sp. YIM S08009]|uniref:bifunctional glycosyltransferase/CDP-glycerol:glycerophosphate glycerophosphotransferase n=1 Tax=Intrasporangium zincisolvens TaxID=3080018 RepID=UPI002B05D74B|nr:glycosyltransferase [Intrasporangium sp. YIM S08009]
MSVPDAPNDLTVIVPIYNVESYLTECLESIEAQPDFAELEVVLVDDGSTDASGDIAARFAGLHDNVHLIRQPNAGLGAARNAGLDASTRTFVAFCDSDDVLPADATSTLRSLVTDDVDVVVGNMRTFPQATTWPWQSELTPEPRCVSSLAEAPALVHSASACNKVFRRSHLESHGLRFGEGVHFEDVYVTLPALLWSRGTVLTRTVVYQYRKREVSGSIMDSLFSNPTNFEDHLLVEEMLSHLLPGLDEDRAAALRSFMVRSFQGFLLRAPDMLEGPALRDFFDRAVSVYRDFPAEAVTDAALNARHRIPYGAVMKEDFELFSERATHATRVRAQEGRLVLDRYDDLDDVMSLDTVHAWLESVSVRHGKELVLTGRLNVPGLDLSAGCTLELGLRVRGSGITTPARVVERPDVAVRAPELRYSGFEAVVPLSRLKEGQHHMRLVFLTPTGQASTRTKPSQGYLRSARHHRRAGLSILPRVDRWDNCQLSVRRAGTPAERRRLSRSLLREDVTAFRKRAPFGAERLRRALSRPFMRGKDIWLLGERRDTTQDNSVALFRYIRRHHPELPVYYVLDRDAPGFADLARLGNVVAHSSRRHRWLMLHASVLVNSYDIDAYMLPDGWSREQYQRHLAWRVGSRRVFLQHGVIYNDVSHALHRGITGFDLFCTSSEAEADFVRERMDYTHQVVTTGLARFDTLVKAPAPRPRVLFMPTWRSYLVSPSYARTRAAREALADSAYVAFLRAFLASPDLQAELERHDATLEFLPHYEVAPHVRDLIEAQPRYVFGDPRSRDIQSAIRECSVFVTDWSSTFFDAAYLGTPMVLCPFDRDDFYSRHYRPGYFDPVDHGFGPAAVEPEDAVAAVVGHLRSGGTVEATYVDRADAFFAHRDRSNAERIVEAITSLR